jgi:hypothetical protein
MIVMLANSGIQVGYLAGRFPGRIGHLISPGDRRGPYSFIPYALDNGAFGAHKNHTEWNESRWLTLLEWARISGQNPRWVLVPDVVGDRLQTISRWEMFHSAAARYGWPLAFAVQDGMTPQDVPVAAEIVFVGGSTEFKWATARMWCAAFPRVHVGRVNEYKALWVCHEAGAESVDGSGWTRQPAGRQFRGLVAYLEETSGHRERVIQQMLFGDRHAVHLC